MAKSLIYKKAMHAHSLCQASHDLGTLRPCVVAFTGDSFGGRVTPEHLREDMGDPMWVDAYMGYQRCRDNAYIFAERDWEMLRSAASVILIGYSRGGDVVRFLTCWLRNVAGCLVYEAPCFARPCGTAPACVAFNEHSLRTHRADGRLNRKARDTLRLWDDGRQITGIQGTGRHVKRVDRAETLNLGHGWDVGLNPYFEHWVSQRSTRMQ